MRLAQRQGKTRQQERGVALMAVLGLALLFGITLLLVLSLSHNRAKSTRHGVERIGATYAAESGYWWALAHVYDNPAYTNPAGNVDLTFPGQPQDFKVDVVVTDLDNKGHKKVESRVTYENF